MPETLLPLPDPCFLIPDRFADLGRMPPPGLRARQVPVGITKPISYATILRRGAGTNVHVRSRRDTHVATGGDRQDAACTFVPNQAASEVGRRRPTGEPHP